MQIPAAESRFPASETAKHSGSTDAAQNPAEADQSQSPAADAGQNPAADAGQILAGAGPRKTAAAEIARAVGSE